MLVVKLPVAILATLLSVFSQFSFAEEHAAVEEKEAEPIYQVEFLVLRPYQRDEIANETWSHNKPQVPYPLTVPSPVFNNYDYSSNDQPLTLTPSASIEGDDPTASAIQPITTLEGFNWSTQAQWSLPFTIKRLNRGGEYEILLHKSWRQTATARDQLVPLKIALAFDERNQVMSPTQAAAQQATQQRSQYDATTNTFETKAENGLFGTFAFSKGRYLHLTMDLLLAEQQLVETTPTERYGFSAPSADGEAFSFGLDKPEAQLNYYRLNETRRIKAEQTHYFDHPAFSVLAYVSKVEEAAPSDSEPSANTTP